MKKIPNRIFAGWSQKGGSTSPKISKSHFDYFFHVNFYYLCFNFNGVSIECTHFSIICTLQLRTFQRGR